MTPRAWKDPRGRLFWLELGLLWTFSRVLWKWYPIAKFTGPEVLVPPRGLRELPEAERLEVVAAHGSPSRPRVDAGGECIICGVLAELARVYFGTRGPFCGPSCRAAWLSQQPTVDRRAVSAKR